MTIVPGRYLPGPVNLLGDFENDFSPGHPLDGTRSETPCKTPEVPCTVSDLLDTFIAATDASRDEYLCPLGNCFSQYYCLWDLPNGP